MEPHKLTEHIAADRYLCTKAAANSRSRGLRFNKLCALAIFATLANDIVGTSLFRL
jgi:hypothetical protein